MTRNRCSTPIQRAAGAACLAILGACGGGGGGGESPPPPPVVSVAPATFSIKVDEFQQFTATVTGSSNTAVTWSVTGPGCAGTACGSVDNAGLYSAPSVVPVPPTVNVIATAQADPTRTASAALTVGSDVALTVWPQTARVTTSTSRQFVRMLTGSTNAAVNWRVSGTGCAANCGSVNAAGLYQAPALIPAGVSSVTITATSVVDPGKFASAAVTLHSLNVQKLSGSYAYLERGVWGAAPSDQAGSFVLNGSGAITSGVVDRINRAVPGQTSGNAINQVLTGGSYSIGDDTRGVLTQNFPGAVTWATAVPTSGERFFMQPFYDTAVRGTAVALKQDPNAFVLSAINGAYAFQWTGWDANDTRIANIGRFTADGAGVISNGRMDINDGSGSNVIGSATFIGTYSVAANGRGAMQLVVPGGGTFNYSLYVVSGDTLIVISIDPVVAGTPMRSGFALRQSVGPFSAASLTGNYVFDLAGRNSSTSAIATVGRMASDGAGNLSVLYDRNDNYLMTPVTGQPISATYTIDANGRGLWDGTMLVRAVFYMVSPNKALLMEAPNARVQTGTLERQVDAPYSMSNLIGPFAGMTSPAMLQNSVVVTGLNAYDGQGNVPSVLDIASPCSLVSGGLAGAGWTVSSAGRVDVRDSFGAQHAAGYLITPTRYVMVLQRASSGSACDEVVHVVTTEQ